MPTPSFYSLKYKTFYEKSFFWTKQQLSPRLQKKIYVRANWKKQKLLHTPNKLQLSGEKTNKNQNRKTTVAFNDVPRTQRVSSRVGTAATDRSRLDVALIRPQRVTAAPHHPSADHAVSTSQFIKKKLLLH